MKTLQLALLALCVFLYFSTPAQAYLDPGSGSMVLQVLLGGLAAAAVVIKLLWHRIMNFFGKPKIDPAKENESESSDPPEG